MLRDSPRLDAAQIHHSWWGEGNKRWWAGTGGVEQMWKEAGEINGLRKEFYRLRAEFMSQWSTAQSVNVRYLGVQRCLLQLQLRWKQNQDRKQKESSIRWCVWGQKQSGPIKSSSTVSKQRSVLLVLWQFTDRESRLEKAGKPQENKPHLKLDQLFG